MTAFPRFLFCFVSSKKNVSYFCFFFSFFSHFSSSEYQYEARIYRFPLAKKTSKLSVFEVELPHQIYASVCLVGLHFYWACPPEQYKGGPRYSLYCLKNHFYLFLFSSQFFKLWLIKGARPRILNFGTQITEFIDKKSTNHKSHLWSITPTFYERNFIAPKKTFYPKSFAWNFYTNVGEIDTCNTTNCYITTNEESSPKMQCHSENACANWNCNCTSLA
jgi:hypothetical protein